MDYSVNIPSKDDVGGNYPVLPADNYIAYIFKIEPNKQIQKFDSFQKRGRKEVQELPPEEIDIVHNVSFVVYGLKSRDILKDTTGKQVNPMTIRLWKQVNAKSIGYQLDNSPSHLRAFIAYASNQDVNSNLKLDSLLDLEDKFIGIDVGVDKNDKNRVIKFTNCPGNFVPDMDLVKTAVDTMKQKALDKQSGISFTPATATATANDDFSTDEITIEDVPF